MLLQQSAHGKLHAMHMRTHLVHLQPRQWQNLNFVLNHPIRITQHVYNDALKMPTTINVINVANIPIDAKCVRTTILKSSLFHSIFVIPALRVAFCKSKSGTLSN